MRKHPELDIKNLEESLKKMEQWLQELREVLERCPDMAGLKIAVTKYPEPMSFEDAVKREEVAK